MKQTRKVAAQKIIRRARAAAANVSERSQRQLQRLKRQTYRRLVNLTAMQFAGIVNQAEISDGRTLNIEIIPTSPRWSSASVWIVDRRKRRLHSLRTTVRWNKRITATGDLADLTDSAHTAPLLLAMCLGSKTRWVRYGKGTKGLNKQTIVPRPTISLNGVSPAPAAVRAERFAISMTETEPACYVKFVDTSLYRVRIGLIAHKCEVLAVRYRLRKLGVTVEQTTPTPISTESVIVDVDLDRLTEAADVANAPSPSIWDVHVFADGKWFPAKTAHSDIANPRNAIRYSTVPHATQNNWNKFRPYWTVAGKLALEHFSQNRNMKDDDA